MKKLQQILAAVLLTFVFSLPAIAGHIGTPGATTPPSPEQSSVTGHIGTPGATATGDISFPGVDALDPVTEAVLGLLQGLMSLF